VGWESTHRSRYVGNLLAICRTTGGKDSPVQGRGKQILSNYKLAGQPRNVHTDQHHLHLSESICSPCALRFLSCVQINSFSQSKIIGLISVIMHADIWNASQKRGPINFRLMGISPDQSNPQN
jgi:hypothetical protein